MDFGKRSKNFTEREKVLLTEMTKEFVPIIDLKKTDGTTVEAKKQAWVQITSKYNGTCESGPRSEKQLHALYDNLKKKARKNIGDDKAELHKTGGRTYLPKTTVIDEKVVALLTPQCNSLTNVYVSSAPNYQDSDLNEQSTKEELLKSPLQEVSIVVSHHDLATDTLLSRGPLKIPHSSNSEESESITKIKKVCLTDTKRKTMNNMSTSIIKRKKLKQNNEDLLTAKKLEILEIEKQQVLMKLKKTELVLDAEIELKKILIENAKLELEFKKCENK